jgi:hypothetical protein
VTNPHNQKPNPLPILFCQPPTPNKPDAKCLRHAPVGVGLFWCRAGGWGHDVGFPVGLFWVGTFPGAPTCFLKDPAPTRRPFPARVLGIFRGWVQGMRSLLGGDSTNYFSIGNEQID